MAYSSSLGSRTSANTRLLIFPETSLGRVLGRIYWILKALSHRYNTNYQTTTLGASPSFRDFRSINQHCKSGALADIPRTRPPRLNPFVIDVESHLVPRARTKTNTQAAAMQLLVSSCRLWRISRKRLSLFSKSTRQERGRHFRKRFSVPGRTQKQGQTACTP